MKRLKEKYCIRCGVLMSSVGIGTRDWNKKVYCSMRCRRGTNKTPEQKQCLICNGDMYKKYTEAWKRWNGKKFCSRPCITKGTKYKAPKTAFKKGNKPWNDMKVGYGYQAVHAWLRRNHKKTGLCVRCGCKAKTQWANVTGKYKKDISNFIEMCRSCHYYEDAANPKRPKMTQS